MQPVETSLLTTLEPMAALSPGRVQELASMCMIETVSQGLNPFRMNVVQSAQSLYLLKGDLKLVFTDGREVVLHGGSGEAAHPVVTDDAPLREAVAMTEIQILRVDADLLDIMLTWDQLADYEKTTATTGSVGQSTGEWMEKTGVFSADALKNGIFSALPPANVEEMFRRMERLPVKAGQVIIRQGDEGDYYYLIEAGSVEVARTADDGVSSRVIARLDAGKAFGEEALVSGNKRNATVTMQTEGVLLRLGKPDFIELLQKPLLASIDINQVKDRVAQGSLLLDVRLPSEYRLGHFPGAINIPLNQIRELVKTLDKGKDYITYCKSGRRASAAAFILAQTGFNVLAMNVGN